MLSASLNKIFCSYLDGYILTGVFVNTLYLILLCTFWQGFLWTHCMWYYCVHFDRGFRGHIVCDIIVYILTGVFVDILYVILLCTFWRGFSWTHCMWYYCVHFDRGFRGHIVCDIIVYILTGVFVDTLYVILLCTFWQGFSWTHCMWYYCVHFDRVFCGHIVCDIIVYILTGVFVDTLYVILLCTFWQGFSWTHKFWLRTTLQCVVVIMDGRENTPYLRGCLMGQTDTWHHTEVSSYCHQTRPIVKWVRLGSEVARLNGIYSETGWARSNDYTASIFVVCVYVYLSFKYCWSEYTLV